MENYVAYVDGSPVDQPTDIAARLTHTLAANDSATRLLREALADTTAQLAEQIRWRKHTEQRCDERTALLQKQLESTRIGRASFKRQKTELQRELKRTKLLVQAYYRAWSELRDAE